MQTLAEKLAWDLSTEYKFDLVSINPSFMLGPAVSAYGTSNSIMEMKVRVKSQSNQIRKKHNFLARFQHSFRDTAQNHNDS